MADPTPLVYLLHQEYYLDAYGEYSGGLVVFTSDSLDLARQYAWEHRHKLSRNQAGWYRLTAHYLNTNTSAHIPDGDTIQEFYAPDGTRLLHIPEGYTKPHQAAMLQEYVLTKSWEEKDFVRANALFTSLAESAPETALAWYEHLPKPDHPYLLRSSITPLIKQPDPRIRLRILTNLPTATA